MENTIAKNNETNPLQITAPEIKEIKQEDLETLFPQKESAKELPEKTAKISTGKQDWL
jgi:hypothetical protein